MSNVNRKAAQDYNRRIRTYMRRFDRDVISPFITEVVRLTMVETARITPYNLGTLRGLWMVTVNSSGRLPGGSGLDDISRMVERNMKKYRLGKEIAIENDAPYAEDYEYGLFEPATPAYRELGGSLALHVPIERRSEKRGEVLIVQGYNITAPQGMVSEALDYVNALLSVGALGDTISPTVTV